VFVPIHDLELIEQGVSKGKKESILPGELRTATSQQRGYAGRKGKRRSTSPTTAPVRTKVNTSTRQ
jgi:hypothetical protein